MALKSSELSLIVVVISYFILPSFRWNNRREPHSVPSPSSSSRLKPGDKDFCKHDGYPNAVQMTMIGTENLSNSEENVIPTNEVEKPDETYYANGNIFFYICRAMSIGREYMNLSVYVHISTYLCIFLLYLCEPLFHLPGKQIYRGDRLVGG